MFQALLATVAPTDIRRRSGAQWRRGNTMCGRCLGWDDPCTLLRQAVCHFSISKDVEGEFGSPTSERRVCREEDCVTLTSDQQLTLKLGTHADCDRVPEL